MLIGPIHFNSQALFVSVKMFEAGPQTGKNALLRFTNCHSLSHEISLNLEEDRLTRIEYLFNIDETCEGMPCKDHWIGLLMHLADEMAILDDRMYDQI